MRKSILAGILISIGCIIFTSVGNIVIGSALFSLGLLTICNLKLSLYTGKAGYYDRYSVTDLLKIFSGNVIGCVITAIISYQFINHDRIDLMVDAKLNTDIWIFYVKSIFCGALMYIGVEVWSHRQPGCYLAPIMSVMVFILAGFEHSVADTFYFFCSFKPISIIYIIVAVFGNYLGAISCRYLQDADI